MAACSQIFLEAVATTNPSYHKSGMLAAKESRAEQIEPFGRLRMN